ncbi:MAG: GHKL domain-containing protein [Deltaproteobacteria bacterium]|nr:GHKL domain-containing protein [Deltaproteobacteria bacterium]MBW2669263.1 GHKL domain-containing protein [Deltaproteobacteria bacterium]
MALNLKKWFNIRESLQLLINADSSSGRYQLFRRNIRVLMIVLTIAPLSMMALINYHQYQSSLKQEMIDPTKLLVSKTRHSFEFFLKERQSLIKSISHFYSHNDLCDEKTLNHILFTLKKEFIGFIDLGLINGSDGTQACYVGPYKLLGKNYVNQDWFQEVTLKGTYISDVFMGYRKFPHIVIAVQRFEENGESWILRTTIDTTMFDNLIAAMGLDAESDAFILNKEGIFQTNSRLYGKVLEQSPLKIPTGGHATYIDERKDPDGKDIFLTYSRLTYPEYTLVIVKPKSAVFKTWYALKSDLFFVFLASSILIVIVIFRLTDIMVNRIREADHNREIAFRELQHHHKLSSIGRLAAGVAHEINNPLAIINEKAGLIKDLIEYTPDFAQKEKFSTLLGAILQSVSRCRTITHRLLGFAKRMEVEVEILDLNELIEEVLGFMEKEALYRNIDITLELARDLPKIDSDRGQLQQIFLNILNNAMAAMEDEGRILISTWEKDADTVVASIQDNGCGMSEETCRHIFEPFFTSKKEHGTGLGLSITYGIVKKLGGDIEVKSKEHEGTTFKIFLPKKSIA